MTGSTRRAMLLAVPVFAATIGVAVAAGDTSEPTHAQPRLRTVPLRIVGPSGPPHDLTVEVASTPREQQVGLMFRRSVSPDGGMLFTWGEPQVSQMWMENTLVPLDMVFIAANGTIDSISENTVPRSLAIVASSGPVVATLELAAGTTARLGVTVGDHVRSKALPAS